MICLIKMVKYVAMEKIFTYLSHFGYPLFPLLLDPCLSQMNCILPQIDESEIGYYID